MKIISRITLICCLVTLSCKSTKSTTEYTNIPEISTRKIIQNHYDSAFSENTIYARLNVKYDGPKSGANLQIKLRLERDKSIWISATKLSIPIAKLLVSPTEVRYYEKIGKTKFEGDFSLLNKWLGADLDFEKLQNILLGQAVFDLKKGKYTSGVSENSYTVQPKNAAALYSILYRLNPEHFKMQQQELRHNEKNQKLAINYSEYQKVGNELFPKRLQIKAVDNNKMTKIGIEYKSIEVNRKLSFPFTFPKGYKEIKFN